MMYGIDQEQIDDINLIIKRSFFTIFSRKLKLKDNNLEEALMDKWIIYYYYSNTTC